MWDLKSIGSYACIREIHALFRIGCHRSRDANTRTSGSAVLSGQGGLPRVSGRPAPLSSASYYCCSVLSNKVLEKASDLLFMSTNRINMAQ